MAPARQFPVVSIIIPCFNRSTLIGEAIRSALAQGEENEIIVVDDGSTDDSWDRIRAFQPKIRAFRTANLGVSAARNLGIGEAQGRFTRFLDSDDRIPGEALAKLAGFADTLRADHIAFGDAIVTTESGKPSEHAYGYADAFPPGPLPAWALFARPMPSWLPLFPTQVLRAANGFDTRFSISEDQELSVRLLGFGLRFIRHPIVVAELREHSGERLTRQYGASGYDRLLSVQKQIAGDERWAGTDCPDRSRIEFSRLVWTIGRNAAREGFAEEAGKFFRLADSLSGADSQTPNPALRLLYRLFDPVTAERLLERVKPWKARASSLLRSATKQR